MSAANRPAPAPAPARSVSLNSSPAGARDGRGQKRQWEGGEGLSSRKININIHGQDGAIVTYHVPVDLPMQKLLKKYCEHKNLEYLAMEFILADGHRVQVRRTAEELHLGDGEQIDAMVRVGGGGGGGGAKVETICTN